MDGPSRHYTKRKKPGRERQVLDGVAHTWNLKGEEEEDDEKEKPSNPGKQGADQWLPADGGKGGGAGSRRGWKKSTNPQL